MAPFTPSRFVSFTFALFASAALCLGCDRGTGSEVYPLPSFGFSETEAVGNRGTQPHGVFGSRGNPQGHNATTPEGAATSAIAMPPASANQRTAPAPAHGVTPPHAGGDSH
jgi:hypothetical protein